MDTQQPLQSQQQGMSMALKIIIASSIIGVIILILVLLYILGTAGNTQPTPVTYPDIEADVSFWENAKNRYTPATTSEIDADKQKLCDMGIHFYCR